MAFPQDAAPQNTKHAPLSHLKKHIEAVRCVGLVIWGPTRVQERGLLTTCTRAQLRIY